MLIDGGRAVSLSGIGRQEAVAHADARRPAFTERALGHGIAGTFAVPLHRGGTPLGATCSCRIHIEQAKGMLDERWGIEADQAFAALRQYARRRRPPLNRVAEAVIERGVDDAGLRRAGPEDRRRPSIGLGHQRL